MANAPAAELLLQEIERTKAYREGRGADTRLAQAMKLLNAWQAERLARTYADLRADPRYEPATEFFLSDLYGPKDFTERDESVEKLYPYAIRVLSEHALQTIAQAMELNLMTHELDHALAGVLVDRLKVTDRITEADYCEAYRRCDNFDRRKHQIGLIRKLGEDLDAVVAKPMIYAALRLARRPAQLAGLHELQDFLERGFRAYRHMNGAKEFLDAVESRETRILERIYARDPKPFRLDRR